MTAVKANPFPEIADYWGQYQSWKQIKLPNGEVVYELPGHPGYIFNPIASNASGKIVIRPNPTDAINDEKQKKEFEEKARKQAEFNQSPAGQLLPVIAGTGGTIAGIEILKEGPKATGQIVNGQVLMNDGTLKAVPGATQAPAQIAAGAPAQAGNVANTGASSVGGAVQPIGQNADGSYIYAQETNTLPPGSTVTPDGAVVDQTTGQVIGRTVQGAAGLYQIYQGAKEFKEDKVGGVLGIASGANLLGSAIAPETFGVDAATGVNAYAGPLLAAKGGYDMYNSFNKGGEGIRSAGTTLGAGIGTMIMPGLGTLAGGAIGNIAGYGLDKLGFGRQTTTQRETGRWENAGIAPEQYGSMIGHDYFQGTEGEKSRDEKFLTPDAIRMNPDNYNNVPEWDTWTKEKQDQFLSTLLNEGKVSERKGGIYYDDARAKEIADQIRGGGIIQPVPRPTGSTIAQPLAPANIAAGAPPRSTTSSPGIGLNGLPIPVKKQPLVIRR